MPRFNSLLGEVEALNLVALALKGANCGTKIVADGVYGPVVDAAAAFFVTDPCEEGHGYMNAAVRGALAVGGFYDDPSGITIDEDTGVYDEDIAAVKLFMELGRATNPEAFADALSVAELLEQGEAEEGVEAASEAEDKGQGA